MSIVTDGLQGLLGLLLVAGLFVAYGVERRRKRLARQRPPGDSTAVTEPATEAHAPPPGDERPARSMELGCLPIAPSVLLLLTVTHRDDIWGTLWQVVFFALVALAAWSAFSPTEFARAQRSDPALTRRDHRLHLGIGFVVLPLLGWGLAVPLRWTPGVFIPVLPWAMILAYTYVASAVPRLRR